MKPATRFLRHAHVRLALHTLREAQGRPLLLLHELGGCSPRALPEAFAGWPGGVYALDFTGHGESTIPRGGGYSAEVLLGDADTALEALTRATVVGSGLGAYAALLLAGARPKRVRGAVLCDGAGLAGGGPLPGLPRVELPAAGGPGPPDPFALAELSSDVRPPDYAAVFAEQALALSGLSDPLRVCARERPPWLEGLLALRGVAPEDLPGALAHYASVA